MLKTETFQGLRLYLIQRDSQQFRQPSLCKHGVHPFWNISIKTTWTQANSSQSKSSSSLWDCAAALCECWWAESSVSLQGSGVSAGPPRVPQLDRETVNESFVTAESSSCTVCSFFSPLFLLAALNDPRLRDDRLWIWNCRRAAGFCVELRQWRFVHKSVMYVLLLCAKPRLLS